MINCIVVFIFRNNKFSCYAIYFQSNFNYFSLIGYFEQYVEYDPFFIQPEFTNPWISDNSDMWEQEKLAYV